MHAVQSPPSRRRRASRTRTRAAGAAIEMREGPRERPGTAQTGQIWHRQHTPATGSGMTGPEARTLKRTRRQGTGLAQMPPSRGERPESFAGEDTKQYRSNNSPKTSSRGILENITPRQLASSSATGRHRRPTLSNSLLERHDRFDRSAPCAALPGRLHGPLWRMRRMRRVSRIQQGDHAGPDGTPRLRGWAAGAVGVSGTGLPKTPYAVRTAHRASRARSGRPPGVRPGGQDPPGTR